MAVVQHSIGVRALELRRYEAPLPSFSGTLHASIRRCRGLPNVRVCEQQFMFAETDATEAWYGPYGAPFGLEEFSLRHATAALRAPCSLEDITRVAAEMDGDAPRACAALDGVVWDAAARAAGVPLWRFLNPKATPRSVDMYASVLGTPRGERALIEIALMSGYDIVKVSALPASINRLCALDLPLTRLALDGHAGLTSDDVRTIAIHARGIAWLEDPHPLDAAAAWRQTSAWHDDAWPPIAAGEDVTGRGALASVLEKLPVIAMANMEVEALGITNVLFMLRWIESRHRGCLMHGRMPLVAAHLMRAFPRLVQHVESQLSFVGERLATLWDGECDERELLRRRLDAPGVGAEPCNRSKLIASVRLL